MDTNWHGRVGICSPDLASGFSARIYVNSNSPDMSLFNPANRESVCES